MFRARTRVRPMHPGNYKVLRAASRSCVGMTTRGEHTQLECGQCCVQPRTARRVRTSIAQTCMAAMLAMHCLGACGRCGFGMWGIICLHKMCPAAHCECAAHHREYALITTSTSRSLSRIRCSDRRTAQHRGVSVARHRVRRALLVHGLPVALEYVAHDLGVGGADRQICRL